MNGAVARSCVRGARHETSVLFNEAERGKNWGTTRGRRVLIHGEDQLFPLRTLPRFEDRPFPSLSAPRRHRCISRRHVVPFSRLVPLNLHLSRVARVTHR